MKEVKIIPSSLAADIKDYFKTTTDDTTLYAPGIGPCIGGLFYRQGHLGLGHFDPMIDSVMLDISDVVRPQMQEHGYGDIGCRLFTGASFATRREFQGEEGVERYISYVEMIKKLGFVFDESGSRTYLLANQGPFLLIRRLQAKLTSNGSKVDVQIQYVGKDGSDGVEESVEEFEIDMETNQTRVVRPFTGHSLF